MASSIRMDLAMALANRSPQSRPRSLSISLRHEPGLEGRNLPRQLQAYVCRPIYTLQALRLWWVYEGPNLVLNHRVHFGFHGLKPLIRIDVRHRFSVRLWIIIQLTGQPHESVPIRYSRFSS
ncbi:UNVERIFIED_CONTAM: hypothetical protein Slati_0930500 [Sesamum latifolium]|uniref:Uncharacterized protein n=1 Tax=Sesamum latifolium TaxID=2727402 RepID=A0AAW2XPV4_9LAMI